MFNFLVASSGCYDWPVIKQIIQGFGWAIGYLYKGQELIGIANLGVCIIIFTLIVKCILLPLTIRQQKFTKLQNIMQPEIKAIQAKYAGRQDQAAMSAMQEETKAVYAKYGTSQMGGCLQTGIQMPIIIALYGAIRNMALYIEPMKAQFETIVNVLNNSGLDFSSLGKNIGSSIGNNVAFDTQVGTLYTLPIKTWDALLSMFSGTDYTTLVDAHNQITQLNNFCGIDMSQTPWNLIFHNGGNWIGIVAILIPIISGVGQWLSFKLSQTANSNNNTKADQNDMMGNSMKSMGLVMPLISVFFCFTIQSGVGLYWAMASIFQVVLQILINRHYRKIDMDAFVKKNMEKAAIKAEKKKNRGREVGRSVLTNAANTNTKNIEAVPPKKSISEIANMNVNNSSTTKKNVNPNSLAAKAGMVQEYNEAHQEEVVNTKKKYKK